MKGVEDLKATVKLKVPGFLLDGEGTKKNKK
jgi:hypothetical protein